MKKSRFKPFGSAIGLRMMGQYLALALLPLVALAAWLDQGSMLSASLIDTFEQVGLGAAVAALVLGALHGELIARRLRRLMDSARSIAKQDFAISLPPAGGDELGQLTRSFNEMARTLGTSLSIQGILSQMDDAILTKLDVAALIRNALRCMRYVAESDLVVLGLFESDTADTMRLFVMGKGERNRIDSHKIEMSSELRRRIPMTPTSKTEPQSPFPEEFEQRLRNDNGVGHFLSMPVSRGARAWGVMVTCHHAAAELSNSQMKMLIGVSNRLIAGFSGAERDQKLHSLAYVDPLTGLPNRVAMQSLLAKELTNSERTKSMAAILFIDLDRFKQANDTHGHAFGDRLLIQAANRIRNHVREDDIVARIGGDEFTVILSEVKTTREAASVARKLIQSLSRRFEIEGQTIYTGASVGIAMYPDDGTGGAELLKMADTAMYRAKSAGRSRFAFYEEPMNAESKRRSLLDGELRNALERHELMLHYQPQIDLKTGALCGVEALVRWQHPTRGLLFPKDFVEYAEEIGLIPQIGAWVMMEACLQYQRWREQGVRVPRVSVNVSNGQLPRSNFVPTVRQLLNSIKVPPGALEIEVTESMLIEGGKPAMEALNQLSADGVIIAIDDFGTGYSSFSYLKTMPARVLKLDMSFLVDARLENDAGKIVAAIINMAHALQKEVVAEGIERVDQLKLLKTLGCERGQGYLFGKPVDAEHITRTFGKIHETTAPVLAAAEAPAPAATPAPPSLVVPSSRSAQSDLFQASARQAILVPSMHRTAPKAPAQIPEDQNAALASAAAASAQQTVAAEREIAPVERAEEDTSVAVPPVAAEDGQSAAQPTLDAPPPEPALVDPAQEAAASAVPEPPQFPQADSAEHSRPTPPGPTALELINFDTNPDAQTVLAVEGWPVPPETNSATTQELLQATAVLLEAESNENERH
ncbi:MAG TPA: EAL domain-containing protein [Burkholderiaceae bacterium]|nr:EAL domain-containing protein [Burkholderiaceae bacterium]